MSITFRPAIRENVGLLVGLAGASGSGKTFTALRLATGICGAKPFAFIDTEARRGLHYADAFKFDHGELRAPFRPDAYADAIQDADKAGYPVIVVDSITHEWASEGGVLDWQEDELDRMAGKDWAKRERVKMAAWIAPKKSHKMMVQKMLQVRAHLILCFRAEEKLEMSKDKDGKTVIVKKAGVTGLDGWFPICEKNLPYELTASFLLMASRPGIPLPIKLQEQHRALFPLDKPITEESGRLLAAWASGATESKATQAPEQHNGDQPRSSAVSSPASAADQSKSAAPVKVASSSSPVQDVTQSSQDAADPIKYVTPEESMALQARCEELECTESFKKAAGVERFALVQLKDLARAETWINAVADKRAKKAEAA